MATTPEEEVRDETETQKLATTTTPAEEETPGGEPDQGKDAKCVYPMRKDMPVHLQAALFYALDEFNRQRNRLVNDCFRHAFRVEAENYNRGDPAAYPDWVAPVHRIREAGLMGDTARFIEWLLVATSECDEMEPWKVRQGLPDAQSAFRHILNVNVSELGTSIRRCRRDWYRRNVFYGWQEDLRRSDMLKKEREEEQKEEEEEEEERRKKKKEKKERRKRRRDEKRKNGEVQEVPTDKRRIESEKSLPDLRHAIAAAIKELFVESLSSTAEIETLRSELEGFKRENTKLWGELESTKADLESTKAALERAELRLQACNAQCGDIGAEGTRTRED